MNQNLQWWLTLLLMGGVTFLLRAAPLLLPKSWLKSQLLQDTNAALPLVVLMLLIISGLSLPAAGGRSCRPDSRAVRPRPLAQYAAEHGGRRRCSEWFAVAAGRLGIRGFDGDWPLQVA